MGGKKRNIGKTAREKMEFWEIKGFGGKKERIEAKKGILGKKSFLGKKRDFKKNKGEALGKNGKF